MQAQELYISPLEREIVDLFHRPSVILFIRGRRGSGKTDISLYAAETLNKFSIIHEFATNIKILESPFPIEHITNMEDLESWLKGSRGRKLFILDEAGKAIRRRSPMSHMNLQILDQLQVIRHYRASLFIIAPGEKFVDSAALGDDILDGSIFKYNFRDPKVAVWQDFMDEREFRLANIPATCVRYDSFDVAPFTRSNPQKVLQYSDSDTKLLWDWSHGMNSTQLGINSMAIHRKTREFIKRTLEKALSP